MRQPLSSLSCSHVEASTYISMRRQGAGRFNRCPAFTSTRHRHSQNPKSFSSLLLRSVSAEPWMESLRERDGKKLAAIVILGFIPGMRRANIAGSKLSAVRPRPRRRLWEASSRGQLGKGAKPPLHPLCRRCSRPAETVPDSAPFGLSEEVSI